MSLYDELTTGPLATEIAPYLDPLSSRDIVAILNRRDITAYGWVSAADLNTWCATNNAEYINIKTLAMDEASPFFAAANALMRCLNGTVDEGAINLASPEIMALIDNWPFVDQTGATKSALLAKGEKLVSRAEQLGISVSENDVSVAVEGAQ